MFSPKVLDRSNVIEFNEINLFGAYGYKQNNEIILESGLDFVKDELNLDIKLATAEETIWFSRNHPEEFNTLVNIFEILKEKNKHFGYRVFNEISAYIKNYLQYLPNDIVIAFDNQILQKILPKLNGDFEEMEDILLNLKEVVPTECVKSIKKIEEMIDTLKTTGYVTFIK